MGITDTDKDGKPVAFQVFNFYSGEPASDPMFEWEAYMVTSDGNVLSEKRTNIDYHPCKPEDWKLFDEP